ncbi:type VI secretion system-associated protein [Vibrio ponticus]|uniref:Type VI secretion system-associated protein n=1 Tax=Vibrio ponticus TaxID=265668 RepID=A0ABX3F679_9VIBR|nr:type VI secretion system-associated protein [Vibrio ponticus]
MGVLFVICSWLVSMGGAKGETAEQTVQMAQQCRDIQVRLERLACFDLVFKTPVEVVPKTKMAYYSPQWNHAMKARKSLTAEQGWTLEAELGDKGNAWIALPATNVNMTEEQRPVLLLSCIKNISRVELALPEQVKDARIQVSIRKATQVWRSDDYGVLFSSGRGIPAIEMMKSLTKSSHLTLRSNARFADGLQFNTLNLEQGLSVLKERCSW